MNKHNNQEATTESGKPGRYIAIGISLGVALGVAMDNIAIGIAIGVAIGAAIDSISQQKDRKDKDKGSEI